MPINHNLLRAVAMFFVRRFLPKPTAAIAALEARQPRALRELALSETAEERAAALVRLREIEALITLQRAQIVPKGAG